MKSDSVDLAVPSPQKSFRILLVCGVLIGVVCLLLTFLSQSFAWQRPYAGRPVRLFVCLMTLAFLLQLIALRSAIRLRSDRRLVKLIIGLGIGFRIVLIPSHPIQEVDIYRYMWDGAVLAEGGNPYQFSPLEVLNAAPSTEIWALQKACELRDSSREMADVLRRVHFGHLSTIYPPVSQFVFAAAAGVVPNDASVPVRRTVTKCFIVVFDVATIFALLVLLKHFRKPVGWLICYAWSPLVLKEFANSGHLDSIAVAFTASAIVLWCQAIQRGCLRLLNIAAVTLGLGVGAKLYPVVIVPVIVASVLRKFGLKGVLSSGAGFAVTAVLTVLPMFWVSVTVTGESVNDVESVHVVVVADEPPPLPPDFDEVVGVAASDEAPKTLAPTQPTIQKGDGLSTFVKHWRMNDLIFLFVSENLSPGSQAWFSIVPQSVRCVLIQPAMQLADMSKNSAAFVTARVVLAIAHLAILFWLATKAYRTSIGCLPTLAFYSLAWFWLLLPTQNPWYWIWALPLVPFAAERSWILISGTSVIYYLRFWLQNDLGDATVFGTGYTGTMFFNLVVVWIEHLPILLLLTWEWLRRRRKRSIC